MATEHRHSWTRFWVTNSVGHGCICHARWDFGDPQSRTFGHAARGCSSGSKSFPPFVLWWIHILHCSAKLPKKLLSTVRHGFFGSSGRRLCIDPAYRAWFVDNDFVITAGKQRAWSNFSAELINHGIQHVRHTQTHYALPRHVQVSRQSAP